jgi:ribosomal protein S18 acetylase RimI-like enzyme
VSSRLLEADGWTLSAPGDEDLRELMTWFPDAASVNRWGGPEFRFPFTPESFYEDCRIDVMRSFALHNPAGMFAAFGQTYERNDRGHLARLIANPTLRRQGAGTRLVEMIIATLETQYDYDEYSLFVYRDNLPAYQYYLSLGFAVTDYPDDGVMADRCYFLTRKRRRSST